MENKNMNIPNISVNGVTEQLAALYVGAINGNIPFKELPTPFLWGPAGVGKSQGVRQLAQIVGLNAQKKVVVVDIRLLLFSPVDLRGVPVADEHRRFTNWLCPKIFKMDTDSDTVNILFLDELSAAPQSVQAAAYQICLDRRVGEHTLPDNCIVIAAGNRTTDQSVSYKMPKALCNRLMHFNIEPDFDSWRAWAVKNGVDSRIIGYLAFDNSRLYMAPQSSDIAYTTPRSWGFVNSLLKTAKCEDLNEIHQLIAACIGNDAAIEFEHWCAVYENLPCVEDILNGGCTVYPKRHDELYVLVSSLVTAIDKRKERITAHELENVCGYAKKFPADFAQSFFEDLRAIKEIRLKLPAGIAPKG